MRRHKAGAGIPNWCGIDCGFGNYGAASEFYEARQDFRDARQETGEANQHFANAAADFRQADQLSDTGPFGGPNIFKQDLINKGNQELAMGRHDLAEAGQDRAEGYEHLERGYEDEAFSFGFI